MSKTRLTKLVRELDVEGCTDLLDSKPELLGVKDDRSRNWLHLCASINTQGHARLKPHDAIPLADLLLAAGLNISTPAFTEGTWQATPLWYAISRGQNLPLSRHLLERGSSPEHCLWAAAFQENAEMIRLLLEYDAPLEAIAEAETPLLGAVKYSKFNAAAWLLEAGANPDFMDERGMTALHYMLKKNSDLEHFRLFALHGARGDIPDSQGRTTASMLQRKRDPAFHQLAESLKTGSPK